MTSGRHGDYLWIEWEARRLRTLLARVPEIVIGRYLVNTSFDSGSLALSEAQRARGWQLVGNRAHSPPIEDVGVIPHDQFDEWLVFDRPTELPAWQPAVNHLCFSLENGEDTGTSFDFWVQLERVRPRSFLAEGTRLVFATLNPDLHERALTLGETADSGD